MKVPEPYKSKLLSEFDHVLVRLTEERRPDEKMFYFSALHGTVNRILNFECTEELIMLHHVLSTLFAAFNGRIQALMQAAEPAIKLDPLLLDKLVEHTRNLAEALREDKDPTGIYRKMIALAYATTGNGYYLYQKGALKIT
jgi:hypothetical protein